MVTLPKEAVVDWLDADAGDTVRFRYSKGNVILERV